jgi:hypothetical protein
MRAAPAVQAVSCGTGAWRWLQAACHALAAAGLTAWIGGWSESPHGWTALAAAAVGLAAAIGADRLSPPRRVPLAWDGTVWRVGGDAARLGTLAPVLDLGGWMLLRFEPEAGEGGRLWLPVSARDVPAWPALRLAVHAGAAPRTGARAGPAAADGVPADP